jgi:hypothetical protein
MKFVLIACVLLACPQFLGAQKSGAEEIKQWQLKVANHEIRVKLSAAFLNGSDNRSTLSLTSEDDFSPTVKEEVDLLRQVLREMHSLGYDPNNLMMISIWLENSEYLEGVKEAVFKSGEWKSCKGYKYCYQAQGAADRFLSSANAFKALDTVLQEYGLRRKAIHMDEMAAGMQAGHFYCSGMIDISLEKQK